MALELNQKAPCFEWIDENGISRTSNEFQGKWTILYFYPKDNTSGCTKEACDFRDNMERITSTGALVFGVSPDSLKSHANFSQKFNLNFTLIPDTEKIICNLYGVMGEKSMYGKKYMGVIRTTYIISPEGNIAKIYDKVKVDGHASQVNEDIINLSK